MHVDHGAPVDVWVELEHGGRRDDVRQVDRWVEPAARSTAGWSARRRSRCPTDLPTGYHVLRARSGRHRGDRAADRHPGVAGPARTLRDRHGWGLAAQLYSVRSRQSWGVGDLTDLTDLAVWSADLGADFVLVNPLHAAEPVAPLEPSPYLPTSRRFFNPLYLRVERIAGVRRPSPRRPAPW